MNHSISTTCMEDKPDSELVALARAGDKAAFGCLIERYQPMARRLAMSIVAYEDLARELTQEAMLQAYLSLKQLRADARFKSWLYGIVLNVCRSYLRTQSVNFYSLEAMAGGLYFDAMPFTSATPSPQEVAEERELHRLVLAAVNALSPAEREATLLFYYDGLTLQEIATVLGISVVAVKGRLHKSRKHLREQLLPLYAQLNQAVSDKERSRQMIKVTVADVLKQERESAQDSPSVYYLVVLLDEGGKRFLPIWVGPWEGQSIAMGIREYVSPRPMTYNFAASLLDAANIKLEEVRVEALKNETFYAVAKLRNDSKTSEIDARPSDAIALAIRTSSPIYVADEVMDKAGMAIPAESLQTTPLRKGAESIIKEIENAQRTMQARQPQSAEATEKMRQETRQKLLAQVFGVAE